MYLLLHWCIRFAQMTYFFKFRVRVQSLTNGNSSSAMEIWYSVYAFSNDCEEIYLPLHWYIIFVQNDIFVALESRFRVKMSALSSTTDLFYPPKIVHWYIRCAQMTYSFRLRFWVQSLIMRYLRSIGMKSLILISTQ